MCPQRGDQVIDGKTRRVGIGEHANDEGAHATFAVAWRVGLCGRGADKRSDPALGLDHASTFQFRVDSRDGIGVDLEIDGQLADCGKLIARAQPIGGDCCSQSAFELRVYRCRVVLIDRDSVHLICCPS